MPINYRIGQKKFEQIGSNICSILALEFVSQANDWYNEDCEGVEVFRERTKAIDNTELSVVNVSYAASQFENKHQGNKTGNNTYYIDVFCQSKSSSTENNDALANLKLQRIMGLIDEMLENPIYKKLGFTSPVVSHTLVEDMEIVYPKRDDGDALASCFGRITFKVRANENTGLLDGADLDEAITTVTVNNGPKGFRYEVYSDADFKIIDFTNDFNT